MSLDRLKINQKSYNDLPNSAFGGWLSVESQPQNPEFRNDPMYCTRIYNYFIGAVPITQLARVE